MRVENPMTEQSMIDHARDYFNKNRKADRCAFVMLNTTDIQDIDNYLYSGKVAPCINPDDLMVFYRQDVIK